MKSSRMIINNNPKRIQQPPILEMFLRFPEMLSELDQLQN